MSPRHRTATRHFQVHPSVLFRLGEDLISDDVQAIAELVKNSYDADGDWAVVRIVTTDGPDEYPGDAGYIEIEDNGVGMDVEVIDRGWLTVSNSLKREMKASGNTTRKGRTPLGDKGLGRLGAQRLGHRLTIHTVPRGSDMMHSLSFDWRDMEHHESLADIDLTITSEPTKRDPGTRIIISDLREPERLKDVDRLQMALAKVISPYKGVAAFVLAVTLDGQALDLFEFETRLRDAAVVRYELDFDGGALRLSGRMRLAHLRPNAKKDRPEFQRTCEQDGGKALLAYLARLPQAEGMGLRASRSKGWWIEFQRSVRIEEIAPELDGGIVASPGVFSGEIDMFNLSAGAAEGIQIFDSLADLRKHISDVHGIRIYRDGFNVRVGEDWLGLGKRWSSAPSWYGLKPATTMGYLALSASKNAQLVETTDREGFKRTPHYDNFEKLLRRFVEETGSIHEFIGRGAVAYRKSLDEPEPDDDDTDALVDRLSATLARAEGLQGPLTEVRHRLETDASEANDILTRLTTDVVQLDDDGMEMLSALNALSRHASHAADVMGDLETFVQELNEQKRVGDRVQRDLQAMEEQLTLTYETVAIGLTAEALSHEIANIAERLARRTTEVARHVQKVAPNDRKIGNFVEHVRGSVAGLRRQLSHLAPSLRYVRERRERIILSELVSEVDSYFSARWRNQQLEIRPVLMSDGVIFINRGKIMQVFDNLLLNSEYWLREELRLGRIEEGEVVIEIDGSTVRIHDNGPGVEREVEKSLFEPFVTRKPSGLGRGLGLYIIRQLLAAEGCDVYLATERNSSKRRYVFELDLSGALVDD